MVSIQKGKQINGEELSENGQYYVMNGGIEPSGYLEEYNTPASTISISEGGNSCGYIQFNKEPFWSGGHCYTLHKNCKLFNYKWLYHYLKFKERDIMALRIGSGLPNIQKKDLEKFEITLPSIESQNSQTTLFDAYTAMISTEVQILSMLQIQKQYLLTKMFI